MRGVVTFAVLAVAAALLGTTEGAASPAQNAKLTGTVGPGYTIVLRDAQGTRVTRLDPGTYDIAVEDRATEHNFHLRGPGASQATGVEEIETVSWTVTLVEGTYAYLCDPHSYAMRGTFVVGNPAPAGVANPTPAASTPVTAKTRLVLTSGPAPVITLKTAAGKTVKLMKRGTYNVSVRDRSRIHNARIRAPGYKRATTLNFVGTQRWRVKLARVGTLRFLCDPHASTGMRGSAKIVR